MKKNIYFIFSLILFTNVGLSQEEYCSYKFEANSIEYKVICKYCRKNYSFFFPIKIENEKELCSSMKDIQSASETQKKIFVSISRYLSNTFFYNWCYSTGFSRGKCNAYENPSNTHSTFEEMNVIGIKSYQFNKEEIIALDNFRIQTRSLMDSPSYNEGLKIAGNFALVAIYSGCK